MDRQAIIAVTLAVVALIFWQVHYTRRMRQYAAAQAERVEQAGPPVQPAAPRGEPGAAPAAGIPEVRQPVAAAAPTAPAEPAVPQVPQVPLVPEVTETVPGGVADYVFTSRGGGIARVELLRHRDVEALGDGKVVLNSDGGVPVGAVTCGSPTAALADYRLRNEGGGVVVCERELGDGVREQKRFEVMAVAGPGGDADAYRVRMELVRTNGGSASVEMAPCFVHTGATTPLQRSELPTYTGFDWWRQGRAKFVGINWFDAGHIPLLGIETRPAREFYEESADAIRWAGVQNQYFASIVTVEGEGAAGAEGAVAGAGADGVWARRFAAADGRRGKYAVGGALRLAGARLEPGASATRRLAIYVGPKEFARLRRLGAEEHAIMNFGMFRIVSEVLLRSMNGLYRVFANFGGYATAIIVLTFIIRSLLWPVQNAATNSMKRMQLLTPKMNELREKYKDDPTRMNQELMKLYKEYGINPFSGCVPMLVQIPIFFGFFSMLGTAVELRHSTFLWVHDLSQPDTILRVAGFPLNVLPLLMAGTMLWQMALTPKSGDPVQQRIFMFMPLIFIAFCYNYASALSLYWTVQNLLSIVQLMVTRNRVPMKLEKVAVAQKRQAREQTRKRRP